MLEAFLRRLSRSAPVDRLVLKGGMLLAAFDLRRPTRDVDLLAIACDNDPFAVRALVVEVGATPDDDGVLFDVDGAVTEVIRDQDLYPECGCASRRPWPRRGCR
ncbi:MAG: nucleotidyl transferase AbiEii/AbiGii toxin family protein [Deltaproteobacteria bacterium]|nr:nucleotidyl transferase AbiEii/AbiGii toxin family protein [Deltaproteobacteria bacterium]